MNISCTVAHDTVIGKHSFLSPSVAIAGFVNVKEQCIIGINSTIIDNITMTAKTQIGGGGVVIKDIDEPGLYVGNPVKFIR
jgi:UDP-3-O-[3-hydroxymyristoyl] glucosamine N-acyltransferase